jgi:hypothetical protein
MISIALTGMAVVAFIVGGVVGVSKDHVAVGCISLGLAATTATKFLAPLGV